MKAKRVASWVLWVIPALAFIGGGRPQRLLMLLALGGALLMLRTRLKPPYRFGRIVGWCTLGSIVAGVVVGGVVWNQNPAYAAGYCGVAGLMVTLPLALRLTSRPNASLAELGLESES
jgi:hypothetical protein